jgi:GNAT superfamily N-acetyltransferase
LGVLSVLEETAAEVIISHVEQNDDQPTILFVDEWWGGRHRAALLPRHLFVHFDPARFIAVDDDQIVGFLIGFVSQAFPNQVDAHFLGVHLARRGEWLGYLLCEHFFATATSLGCRTAFAFTVTALFNCNLIAFSSHWFLSP